MKIMTYTAPKTLEVSTVEEPTIANDEVKVKTIYSAISHGTEMNVYRGIAPFFEMKFDPATRLLIKADKQEVWKYPISSNAPGVWYMGYASVGEVTEVGQDVENFSIGDIVFCKGPHQSILVRKATNAHLAPNLTVKLPKGLKPERAVFLTNLITAYNGIVDAHIKLGDVVVVSGLGVIGQLCAQMAKMSGASRVYGIDMFEQRRKTALENGCDGVYAPGETDIALAIRKKTNNRGADVVIESSGSVKAINEAIRIAAPETTVTAVSWYNDDLDGVNFSREYHHNRIGIKQSQSGNVAPEFRHLWDFTRRVEESLEILKKLQVDNLITHRFAYDKVAEAYDLVDRNPQDTIQTILTY